MRTFICWLFGHKIKYVTPGDITSASRCVRKGCESKWPRLVWPQCKTEEVI